MTLIAKYKENARTIHSNGKSYIWSIVTFREEGAACCTRFKLHLEISQRGDTIRSGYIGKVTDGGYSSKQAAIRHLAKI